MRLTATTELAADPSIGLLVGLSAIAALIYLVAFCWRGPGLLKTGVKTVSVAGLALAAWVGDVPGVLCIALALGALGDFWLSRPGDRAFLYGLIAFASAHIAYIVLIVQAGGVVQWDGGAVTLIIFAAAMGLLLFRRAGGLRWPVLAYVSIIAVMGLVSLGAPQQQLAFAAMAFILSDAVLGVELFVLEDTHPLHRILPFLVWSLYWSAQLLFLAAFIGL